ncbi:hypothetical protein ACFV9C_42330 [Kribbella sp. NPDC059898]|uniref:hypothetical protein n=1 Tax=Kribbella sp. NPDC059898 TaxID=3346995 RepID=UPI0036572562
MRTATDATRHTQALGSLITIDEALVRARYDAGQVRVLRQEAAFLSGLLQSTAHNELALELRDELAAQPVALDDVKQAAIVLHAALCGPATV